MSELALSNLGRNTLAEVDYEEGVGIIFCLDVRKLPLFRLAYRLQTYPFPTESVHLP